MEIANTNRAPSLLPNQHISVDESNEWQPVIEIARQHKQMRIDDYWLGAAYI